MKINVLTLFPDMFTPLQVSMLGRGLEDKKWELNLVNFRNFTTDVHHHVDDTPHGVTNYADKKSIGFFN